MIFVNRFVFVKKILRAFDIFEICNRCYTLCNIIRSGFKKYADLETFAKSPLSAPP